MQGPATIAGLLAGLEERSRSRTDRVLRLRGSLPDGEAFELLIFRGFSSSTTHPTAADPDRPALPEGSRIGSAELLAAPLDPERPRRLGGTPDPRHFLDAASWEEGDG